MDGILVAGAGNPWRGDDGVGIAAVQVLRRESWPARVRFLDAGTGAALSLAHAAEGCGALVLLDAVRSGRAPGSFFRVAAPELESGPGLSAHVGLLDALRLAFLDRNVPELYLLGMEPEDAERYGEGLSAPVRAALPAYIEATRTLVRELLEQGAP